MLDRLLDPPKHPTLAYTDLYEKLLPNDYIMVMPIEYTCDFNIVSQ